MHLPLLADLVVLLLVSIVVLYISHGARLPPVVGFLISGMLVGPHGLGLVQEAESVEQLAEIGVILLLFTIGLEFSLADLLRMRRLVLVGGSIQVFVVTLGVTLASMAAGLPANQAVFLGMIVSLSSTAVVLRLLQQNAQVDAPHGRMSLAMLVYQDLMIVPMMLLVPVLAGGAAGIGPALLAFLVKAVAGLVFVIVLARFVVPQVLERVVHTRNRDLFLLTVVTVCLAVAWMSSLMGLSLALGAFLAGLLVSESEYSHQALADVLPFRDLFASFFFISIGMLLDLRLAAGQPLVLGGLVGGVLVLKVLGASLPAILLGASVRTATLTGLGMSQVGEFSFVLASTGLAAGLLTDATYQSLVATAVATIGLTPFLMRMGPRVGNALDRLPLPDRVRLGTTTIGPSGGAGHDELDNHLIVIGYGVNGRNVSRAARIAGIPYVVVDMNPSLVDAARRDGVPIHYGDASRQAFLEYLGVVRAHVVVVALSDAAATRRVVALARDLNPLCSIVARTRYVREMDVLESLGANVVVPEELETSVEIMSRVLSTYLVPRREIQAFIAEVRAGGYEMLRSPSGAGATMFDLRQTLTDVEITTLRCDPGSPLVGQRLADSDLRSVYGVTVIAIRRGDELRPNPGGEERIEAGDLLVVMGLGEEVAAASALVTREGDADEGPGAAPDPPA
jgi:CPA2 family monovalent cation:H+ antiporter-2